MEGFVGDAPAVTQDTRVTNVKHVGYKIFFFDT